MLQGDCIQVQVRRNPDLKCAVAERVHRTIRNRMYKSLRMKVRTDI